MNITEQAKTAWEIDAPKGPLLRPADAAAFLGIGLSTYYALAKSGDLPPPLKLTSCGRAAGVPKSQLDALIRSRAATPLPRGSA